MHTSMLASRARMGRVSRRETLSAYIFLTPCLLLFAGFVLFPMGLCVVTSFFNYTMADFSFVGFGNYRTLFADPVFVRSLLNTAVLVLCSVPAVMLFSLWVASVVHRMSDAWCSLFRCAFYLPVVTGTVAVTVVWKWMFNKYTGLFNYVLKALGLIDGSVAWLGSADTAIWCILLILFTTSIGQPIVLNVSALNNVDASLIEAAHVDGATSTQTFWRIKWRLIMPTTLYIMVITTINSFQCFALIQLLTSGGPNYSTSTIMYYIYYQTFTAPYRYGYGNAMGVVLAVIIALFSFLQFRMMRTGDA